MSCDENSRGFSCPSGLTEHDWVFTDLHCGVAALEDAFSIHPETTVRIPLILHSVVALNGALLCAATSLLAQAEDRTERSATTSKTVGRWTSMCMMDYTVYLDVLKPPNVLSHTPWRTAHLEVRP